MTDKKPDDLARAQEFLALVAQQLELPESLIEQTMPYLLGMTKHVAHDAVRPAAPLAAFLVGVAVASQGEVTTESVRARIAEVEEAIKEYANGQA